jgi:hypothetical protein
MLSFAPRQSPTNGIAMRKEFHFSSLRELLAKAKSGDQLAGIGGHPKDNNKSKEKGHFEWG